MPLMTICGPASGSVAGSVRRQARASRDDQLRPQRRWTGEAEPEDDQHEEGTEDDAEHGQRSTNHVRQLLAGHREDAEDGLEECHAAAVSARLSEGRILFGPGDQVGEDVVEGGAELADGCHRAARLLDASR